MSTIYSILIIDDEPNLRRSLGLILQRAGYAITSAADAAEALKLLQATGFDLAFLDIKLPDQSGIQLLPQIRQLYPQMPVLILTAHATLDTAIDAVRLGARDYLLKPIDPDDILKRVETILREGNPGRRREITSQIQDLLSELQTIEGSKVPHSGAGIQNSPQPDPSRYIKCGSLVLDTHTHSVQTSAGNLPLPPTTFEYLVTLAHHSPNTVTYEKLVTLSQGYQHLSRAEAREIARWQIHELRKTLETDARHPRYIITVRDIGYRLVE
jgi:DNA-binding response OmpR family regulator